MVYPLDIKKKKKWLKFNTKEKRMAKSVEYKFQFQLW